MASLSAPTHRRARAVASAAGGAGGPGSNRVRMRLGEFDSDMSVEEIRRSLGLLDSKHGPIAVLKAPVPVGLVSVNGTDMNMTEIASVAVPVSNLCEGSMQTLSQLCDAADLDMKHDPKQSSKYICPDGEGPVRLITSHNALTGAVTVSADVELEALGRMAENERIRLGMQPMSMNGRISVDLGRVLCSSDSASLTENMSRKMSAVQMLEKGVDADMPTPDEISKACSRFVGVAVGVLDKNDALLSRIGAVPGQDVTSFRVDAPHNKRFSDAQTQALHDLNRAFAASYREESRKDPRDPNRFNAFTHMSGDFQAYANRDGDMTVGATIRSYAHVTGNALATMIEMARGGDLPRNRLVEACVDQNLNNKHVTASAARAMREKYAMDVKIPEWAGPHSIGLAAKAFPSGCHGGMDPIEMGKCDFAMMDRFYESRARRFAKAMEHDGRMPASLKCDENGNLQVRDIDRLITKEGREEVEAYGNLLNSYLDTFKLVAKPLVRELGVDEKPLYNGVVAGHCDRILIQSQENDSPAVEMFKYSMVDQLIAEHEIVMEQPAPVSANDNTASKQPETPASQMSAMDRLRAMMAHGDDPEHGGPEGPEL